MSRETVEAIDLFAERLSELVMSKVEHALALERDRHESEVGELREYLADMHRRLLVMENPGLHSVRVEGS